MTRPQQDKVNLFGLEPRDVPSFALESQPGDVVFFSHQLWHASFGGRSGRRMFTLNYRIAEAEVAKQMAEETEYSRT